jgi:endonuclease/exonuclease/phosphatase family metal-dependent hydrolase
MPTTLKIITWNMFGAGGWLYAKQYLVKHDIVCLQECGQPPEDMLKALTKGATTGVQWGTFQERLQNSRDKITYHLAYYAWQTTKSTKQAENLRCSLAILTKIDFQTMKIIDPPTNAETRRPVMCIKLVQDDIWACCVHAPSGKDSVARTYTDYMINKISVLPKWFCAGDYNCDPTYMKIGLTSQTSMVTNTKEPTQQGERTLDYVIHNRTATVNSIAVDDGITSDHWPVIIQLTF